MTPKQLWIRARHSASTEKNIALFTSAMNTETMVVNPAPSTNVPKRIDIKQAFDLVTDTEAFAISETRTYDRLLDAFKQGRMDWVQDNIQTLIAGGKMTVPTAQALGALMAQTEPDPNRPPLIMASPAQLAGHELILCDEVVKALEHNT